MDRIKYIQDCNAKIVFNSIMSEIFNKNLVLIDSFSTTRYDMLS